MHSGSINGKRNDLNLLPLVTVCKVISQTGHKFGPLFKRGFTHLGEEGEAFFGAGCRVGVACDGHPPGGVARLAGRRQGNDLPNNITTPSAMHTHRVEIYSGTAADISHNAGYKNRSSGMTIDAIY